MYFERDDASGEYELLDREAGIVRPLYLQRKSLAGVALQRLEPVVITARDGLALNGYMTRPAEAAGNPPPLVLAIHGGPYSRDTWGFSPTHQWLASRGYVVLSVNYRGSTGFGKAVVAAADHEWGGRMHSATRATASFGRRTGSPSTLLQRRSWPSTSAGRCQPIGDDFAGSTIKTETGGELIPGLNG